MERQPVNHVEKLAGKQIEEKTEAKTVAATGTLPTDPIRQPLTQSQLQKTAEQTMRLATQPPGEMPRMEEVKISADTQQLPHGETKMTAPGATYHESQKTDIGVGEQRNIQAAPPAELYARHVEPGIFDAKPSPAETARATEAPVSPQQLDKSAPQVTEARTTNEVAVKPLDAPPAENTMAEQPDKKPAKNQGFQKAAQSLCGKGDACDCAKAENAQVQNIQADAGFDFASADMPSADPATSNRNNPPTQHASFPGLAA